MTQPNQAITEVTAGSIVRAFAQWMLEVPASALGDARVTWELIDYDGRMYNKGDGEQVEARPHPSRPGYYNFKCYSNITIPGTIPVNGNGTKYQIAWTLSFGKATSASVSFDSFTVLPVEYAKIGATDSVDLWDQPTEILLQLPTVAEELKLTVYRGNEALMALTDFAEPIPTAEGYMYRVPFNPQEAQVPSASLQPLSMVWRYKLEGSESPQVENSNLYLINPSILTAMKDVEAFVNRAYTDSGIDPGTTFTPVDLVRHLRKGMDSFNMHIRPTNFTMTNATGGIRQFWVAYAVIDACRAQYLAEGMKSFNYSGQSTSLDVDRSQFWDSMANSLQSDTDQYVKQLKDNLAKWGHFGGDGNVQGPRVGSIGAIGIALTPITPLRQGYYRFFGAGNGQLG